MQLDIFEHSRDVMLRNDVLQALLLRDAPGASRALQALAAEVPQDRCLAPMQLLLSALQSAVLPPFASHAVADDALQTLHGQIVPAARELFGDADGTRWLAPLWRQAAQRCARLDFRAASPRAHAAPLWLHAAEFRAAADAVASIDSWRRIPAPLGWMAEARYRLDGLDASWGLLAELAWLAPARFDALTRHLADPLLGRLRRRFDAEFDADSQAEASVEGGTGDLAWWPAWVLTENPALAGRLGQARPGLAESPERTMRLLLDLLHLEHQARQRELVEQRKRLRDLAPAIFRAYMRSR